MDLRVGDKAWQMRHQPAIFPATTAYAEVKEANHRSTQNVPGTESTATDTQDGFCIALTGRIQ